MEVRVWVKLTGAILSAVGIVLIYANGCQRFFPSLPLCYPNGSTSGSLLVVGMVVGLAGVFCLLANEEIGFKEPKPA